ncbi:MAG: carboxylate-amine ligase [Chthoniobacterales bacterium]
MSDCHVYTLGIEEEFQIIDPATRELRSGSREIIKDGEETLGNQVTTELHQSMIELGTKICSDIGAARRQVVALRSELARLAAREGLKIASAGTHPFSQWADQPITEKKRYQTILRDMQRIARSNIIFGLHVHVGIPDRATGLEIMNEARSFLPHLFALSSNSPFWEGADTGLKTYRQVIFERFPHTGLPESFASLAEYDDYIDLLVSTDCIEDATKLWWDIRLHPKFDTIEFRICDAQSRVDDTIALAALIQAIVARLQQLRAERKPVPIYARRLLQENRWRAARFGLDGELIDFARRVARPERDLIRELLDFIRPVVDELGSSDELQHIEQILQEGTGADRQLSVWDKTQDLKLVVDHLIAETNEGLDPAS